MYKKVLLTSAIVLPMTMTSIHAQSSQGIITASSLNARSGASTSYSIKFVLHKGDKVNIITSSNGWYKITTSNNKTGWVSAKYVEVQNTTTIKYVSASSLNMRKGPSTSYSVITTLTKGEEVEVISEENGWAKVNHDSKTGYVSSKYLSDEKPVKITIKYVNADSLNVREGAGTSYKILGKYKHGDEVKVVSIDGNWAKIQYEDGYAYISNKYLSDEKPVKITIKYVNADTLNVREGAGTSYKILGTYKHGDEVKVVSIDGDWAKIQYEDGYAYISNKYLSDEKPVKVTIKYVNTNTLNIREGAGTEYEILGTYKKGQEVKVVSVDGDWAKIQYEDGYAYISNKYLVDKMPTDSENDNKDNNVGGDVIINENLSYSFDAMVDYEYKLSQQGYNRIKANLSTNYQNSTKYLQATKEDLSKYLNRQTCSTNANGRLQFLKIDKYREGITASELNAFFKKYCKSNSVFLNKGQAFIDAAKKHNLDVSYLVAASMVETGYGSSTLAQGVEVPGENGEKVKVYNFFGISAFDGTAVPSAANYAYKKGWTTIDKTIEGSAKWLATNYIHSSKYKQNTLYKMRWSYNTGHQYATDVSWAHIIAKVMNNIIPYYDNSVSLEFLMPNYK